MSELQFGDEMFSVGCNAGPGLVYYECDPVGGAEPGCQNIYQVLPDVTSQTELSPANLKQTHPPGTLQTSRELRTKHFFSFS